MKATHVTVAGLAVLGGALLCGAPIVRAADGPYHQLKEITIGGEGGWDYLSVDPVARRLYVSHATKVVVVDIDKDAVVGEIAPALGVHGIAIASELGRVFVSNGREGTVSIVDAKTLQITGTVKTGENPDAILYEPVNKEVYAFNGRSKSATVFDAKTGEVRATIPLPGKPEFAVFDEKRPDGGSQSFPSGHSASAFAGAAFLQMRYGWSYGVPAYALATFVAWSRVESKRHWTKDVVAGGAIGIASNLVFTRRFSKLAVQPALVPRGAGLTLSATW